MIYDFVTPSDAITFEAQDDKIAFACAVMLGLGKAGCHRFEKGEDIDIDTMLMFDTNPDKTMTETLGTKLNDFIKENHEEMAKCFQSFAYGDIGDRVQYNEAIAAITDKKKLEEFKKSHEDRNRTSLSKWVKGAWEYAEAIEKQF